MTKLNKIQVAFNHEEHTYTNTETGEQYKGITSTLLNRLFPHKYDGVPKKMMEASAERGSLIHAEIELINTIGIEPHFEECRNYVELVKENNMKYLASEYTVSDLIHYATKIDGIFEVEENVVDIVDYKTTYKLDKEYLSWQLSIDAYFFERNNPDVKVRKLYGIWLRGDIAELVEVERRSAEDIWALISADQNDEPFDWKPVVPEYISENETTIISLTKRIKELTEELDAAKASVLENMEKDGCKSVDTGALLVTFVAPSKRESFDSKKFKEENAELYGKYIKASETKASLKVTIR